MLDWSLLHVGDYVEVEVVNKDGDRNLDGMRLHGEIKELRPEHDAVELTSGWWIHGKDALLVHHPSSTLEEGR